MNAGTINFITKGVGAVGLGLVLYDAHTLGKIESVATRDDTKAKSLVNNYADNLSLDKPSIVKSNVKKGLFNMNLEENLTGFFTGIGGYVKGFSSMLVSHVIPLTLALGTVLAPKELAKGWVSKGFGIGLLAYGGIFLAQELFGIGKSNKITNNF